MSLFARLIVACVFSSVLASPASAQFDSSWFASFSDVGPVCRGAAALHPRRRDPAQLRLGTGHRTVSGGSGARARLRHGVLGRDAVLQPPAFRHVSG